MGTLDDGVPAPSWSRYQLGIGAVDSLGRGAHSAGGGYRRVGSASGRWRVPIDQPQGPGGARGAGRPAGRGAESGSAGRCAVGRGSAGVVAEGGAGLRGPAAQERWVRRRSRRPAGGYRLTLTGDDLDACRFEQLVERGRALAATGEPDRAATTFESSAGAVAGQIRSRTSSGGRRARNEAARLAELRRTVEEDILEARLAAGEHRDWSRPRAEVRVAEEPLRERRWAILALAQYRCGRQAEALRTSRRARRTLVDELGIEPGPGAGRARGRDPASGQRA